MERRRVRVHCLAETDPATRTVHVQPHGGFRARPSHDARDAQAASGRGQLQARLQTSWLLSQSQVAAAGRKRERASQPARRGRVVPPLGAQIHGGAEGQSLLQSSPVWWCWDSNIINACVSSSSSSCPAGWLLCCLLCKQDETNTGAPAHGTIQAEEEEDWSTGQGMELSHGRRPMDAWSLAQ